MPGSEIDDLFNFDNASKWVEKITDSRIKSYVIKKLREIKTHNAEDYHLKRRG